ncbi:unnamed protein product [Phytomonas sp. Hart1]|nr:unnamed protein product [Phytomonas sp. Hart1]|eukprot:CCW68256.1 unnamed protein product [Phytomonas sp. isolate Hart1]
MRRLVGLGNVPRRVFLSSLLRFTHGYSLHEAGTTQKPLPMSTCEETIPLQGEDSNLDVITPWSVSAKGSQGIDYSRVLTHFKTQKVDETVIDRLLEVIQKNIKRTHREGTTYPQVHHFFSRQVAFSHRDFDQVLCELEKSFLTGQQRVFLYTGRGPSSKSIHLGHFIPFLLTKYLQDALNLPLVIQITDDEKYLFRDVPFTGDAADNMISGNIKDIIAFGFNPKRTFIFRNTHYFGDLYPTVLRLQKAMTFNAVMHTLGIKDETNIGRIAFPATQAAPCFASAFPRVLPQTGTAMRCLIPCAVDQDPFFILARSAASRIAHPPPALLHTKFLPALRGPCQKMSSSDPKSGIISAHDSDGEIQMKLRKAFSGGKATLAEMREHGADLEMDMAYQMLKFFCHNNDLFQDITTRYRAGRMDSGEVKNLAANFLINEVLTDWRAHRAKVTDDDVDEFCAVRNILV